MKPLEVKSPNGHSHIEAETIVLIVVDLEEYCINGNPHPTHDPGVIIHYLVKVNDKKYEMKKSHVLGDEIFALEGKNPNDFLLYQSRRKHGEIYLEPISKDEIVNLTAEGVESFIIKAKTYSFSIGRKKYESATRYLTIRQILIDYAHVESSTNTLSTREGKEYKVLDEVIDLECVNQFVIFNDEPTPVS